MREIKELISLEDAKKLIGATVQGAFVNELGAVERPGMSRGIVTDVIVDYEGDLRFSLHGRRNAWLQGPDDCPPWYLEILQEPPTAGPVRLDENTPLDVLQRYIGATVWQRLSFEGCDESRDDDDTFTILTAVRRDCGDLFLRSDDGGNCDGWWLSDGDYVTVVQDPPQATETPDEEETLTARVERLKDELKAAEDELVSSWVPDEWSLDMPMFKTRGPRISDGNISISWNDCEHTEVFIAGELDDHVYLGVSFVALAAWVDHVRAENPDT